MARVEMSYSLAMAVSKDAANANMRKHGRETWNADDYNISVVKFHKLWPCPNSVPCDICNPK